jgi:hypothetical protein
MSEIPLQIAAWSLLGFALLLLAVQVAARELGFWLGQRRSEKAEVEGAGVTLLVGAKLGLLAFVLALTVSVANTRFAERRAGALAEANAIGTAWLRAEALDHPRAAAIARLLEEYARVRREFVALGLEPERIGAVNARGLALQGELWGHLAALVRERPDPVTAALMAALNEAFDAATAERFAYFARVPAPMAWLLVALAVLGMAGIGYQLGLRRRAHRVLALTLTAVWTMVIVMVLDLGAARVGLVRTPTEAYLWTIEGFQERVRIPPLRSAERPD